MTFNPIATQAELEERLRDRLARQKAALLEQQRSIMRATAEATAAVHEDIVARLHRRLIDAEARAVAAELGFIGPALAVRLTKTDDVTVDSLGTVVQVDVLTQRLQEVAEAEPYMVRQCRCQGGGRRG